MTSEEREAYANYCISIMAKNFQSKGYVIKENDKEILEKINIVCNHYFPEVVEELTKTVIKTPGTDIDRLSFTLANWAIADAMMAEMLLENLELKEKLDSCLADKKMQ
jgi:hypothetical protein